MKIQNIALPEDLRPELVRIKWHLWRGKTENALKRLDSLINDCPKTYKQGLEKLRTYIKIISLKLSIIENDKTVDRFFTCNLAESIVESLINQRCKGQQHMRCSREGLDPLLQLRAAMGSNDWDKIWKTAMMNAMSA